MMKPQHAQRVQQAPQLNAGPQVQINPQDVINQLSQRIAQLEIDNAIKQATNIALTKRVQELEIKLPNKSDKNELNNQLIES